MQKAFLGARWFIKVMNVYYGTLHFIITAGLLMWVYLRRHEHYRQYRNLLGMTTALAIIGYLAFPLAPPRMTRGTAASSTRSTPSAGCGRTTRARAKAIANPFAAMPSLHFGWALWCGTPVVVVRPAPRRPVAQRHLPGADAVGDRRDRQPLLARRGRRSGHLLRPPAQRAARTLRCAIAATRRSAISEEVGSVAVARGRHRLWLRSTSRRDLVDAVVTVDDAGRGRRRRLALHEALAVDVLASP